MVIEASVITPVWNRADLTQTFLYHNWLRYEHDPTVELVIVDNNSTDYTAGILVQWQDRMGDRLQVIKNLENLGFGPANNQGAEAARGYALIFLSNDVHVQGDYAIPIAHHLKENPLDLVGAQLLDFDTGWNKFNGSIIAYLAGWCVACTKSTWQTLEGWDERFVPCDYEDIDLSYRASQAGRNLVPLTLPLSHQFGQSALALPGGRDGVTNENRVKFMEKWQLDGQ